MHHTSIARGARSHAGSAHIAVLLAGALCWAPPSRAREYFVAPDGADLNAGTKRRPFKTIARARNAVRNVNRRMTSDITVWVRGGWHVITSPLVLDHRDSGSNGHDVIYRAAKGEYPVVSGGRLITGWRMHDEDKGIWKASAPGLKTRQLYVNCARAVRAHKGSGLGGANRTATGFTTTDKDIASWGNHSDIEFVFNAVRGGTHSSKWTERRCCVARITGTTITMQQPGWTSVSGDQMQWQSVKTPTDIENAYELLDQPGEWYLDRRAGTVYYKPRTGEDMTKARVVAPVLEALLAGKGTLDAPVRNIRFVGLTFAHATWMRPSTADGFAELQANFCRGNVGWAPANLPFVAAREVRFERCVFKHLGAMGLEFTGGSQDCAVEGCVFTDISGTPLKIGDTSDPDRKDERKRDTRNTVRNCYIHHAPCEYRGGVGVFAGYVSDLTIEHNEICWTPYSAVSVGWGWGRKSYARNNQVNYNDFHHWVKDLSDGGAIYSLSPMPGSAWHHNYGHDVPWGDGKMKRGWYTDEGSAGIDIHHNVMARIARAHWYSAWTKTINNNKIRDNFTDTSTHHNNGTNCPMTNNTLVKDGDWPQAARAIMAGAGIEKAWSDVKQLPCACAVCDPDPAAAPSLISARPLSSTSVEVVFSEAVDSRSAGSTRGYALSPRVRVTRAERGVMPNTVVLTTAELAERKIYTLTVNGVRDISSPQKTVARGSRITFVVKGSVLGTWKFDERSGTTARDSSGSGCHATVKGGSWVRGRVGNALDLKPESSVSMNGPVGDMKTFTVAFWIKPRSHQNWNQVVSANGWSRFMCHTDADGGIFCGIDHGDWSTRFGPTELRPGTLTLDTWQHFAFTYDEGDARFYKNGKLLASKKQPLPAAWNGFGISNVDGQIDELHIHAKAITAAEVGALARGR